MICLYLTFFRSESLAAQSAQKEKKITVRITDEREREVRVYQNISVGLC